jgi:hypothetical protein
MSREVWEGWTVQDFIDELEMPFMFKQQSDTPLKSKADVKKWTAYEQPNYKKEIPEVVEHFYGRI